MTFCLNFPLFLIVLSLASAVISSILPAKAARILSLCLLLVSAAANAVLFVFLRQNGESVEYLMGHFPRPWGNELKLSELGSFITALFALIEFLCLLGGAHQIDTRLEGSFGRYYYVMADLIHVSLLVLAYTNDIFTGYVFVEICTLASAGILAVRHNGKTILAATRYMIYSQIGSGLFLFSIIFLYNLTGHLLLPDLKESIAVLWKEGTYRLPLLTAVSFACLGLGIKSGMFPFHLWMSDTYGSTVIPSSGILSGLVSKGYIILLIRLLFDGFGTEVFYQSGIHNIVYLLGAMGVIAGSIGALRENNIFRMTAYSSAAQIGYIFMGIGLSAVGGVIAALFQIFAHALTKPALFLSEGILSDTMDGAKKFRNLQGAASYNHFAGAAFTFEALSMIGLPLTAGFIVKYLFGRDALLSPSYLKMILTLAVIAVSTVLNALYFTRAILRIYNRPQREDIRRVRIREEKGYFAAGLVFIVLNLLLGIQAGTFLQIIREGLQLF